MDATNKPKALMYCRVASAMTGVDTVSGEHLQAQLRVCQAAASREGFANAGGMQDVVPNGVNDPPSLLIELGEADFKDRYDAVFVVSLDVLSPDKQTLRKVFDQCKARGVAIYAPERVDQLPD